MIPCFSVKNEVEPGSAPDSPAPVAPGNSEKENAAATIIQKHIKGYCTRKKYGPLISSSGILNAETAAFIKRYAQRWRNKSLFQILLMYKANRYLDLVYFSQQVHLYNQNVVSSMNLNQNESVSLDQIQTNVDPESYIGGFSVAVWKLPFKFKDFPFCDSSRMLPEYPTPPQEQIPWDQPFVGKSDSVKKKLQRTNSNQKFSTFIQTPYCRDPNETDKFYDKQEFQAPSPLRRKPQTKETHATDFQCNSLDRKTTAKKNVSRPTPLTRDTSSIHEFQRSSLKKVPEKVKTPEVENSNVNGSVHGLRKTLKPSGKVDPIAELEMKGKQASKENLNEDDPPFNFQAMLRKTNHNRNSLKRTQVFEANNIYRVNSKKRTDNNQIQSVNLRKTKFNRTDSVEKIKRLVSLSKDFSPQGSVDEDHGENGTEIKVEILPGLLLIGSETCL